MKSFLLINNKATKGAIVKILSSDSSDYYAKVQNKFELETETRDCYSYFFNLDETNSGLFTNYSLCSDGADYTILAMPTTSKEEIMRCKKQLKRDYDIVGINVIKLKKIIDFNMPERSITPSN